MKKPFLILLSLCALLAFAAQADAYSVSWGTDPENQPSAVQTGSWTNNTDINTLLENNWVPEGTVSLYKNEILKEEGELRDSYWISQLSFEKKDDLHGLIISHQSGTDIVLSPYLLVKDGHSDPAWYLFNLAGWDGDLDLVLSDFWKDGSGSIGQVELLGVRGAQVPIPGTMLLLGSGLLALIGFRRKVNS